MLRKLLISGLLLGILALPTHTSNADPDVTCQVTNQDVPVTMNDGVILAAEVWIPTQASCPKPPDGYPMIISLHGGGGNKDTMDPWAQHNAEKGYIAVNFTWRGFRNTDQTFRGMFALQVEREWLDLREVTEWFALFDPNTSDKVDKTKIGVEGTSMGSANTWIGAARSYSWWSLPTEPSPFQSAVAINTSAYPEDFWVVNKCMHAGITNLFENVDISWRDTLDQQIKNYFINYDATGFRSFLMDTDPAADNRNYSLYIDNLEDTHVFEKGSWTDAFQFLDKSIKAWDDNPVTPKLLYAAANGHEDAPPISDIATRQRAYQDQWHARWLQGDNDPPAPPKLMRFLAWLPNGSYVHSKTTVWPPTGTTLQTYYFRQDETLTTTQPGAGEGSHILTNDLLDETYTIESAIAPPDPDFKDALTKFEAHPIEFVTDPPFPSRHWWLGAPEVTLHTGVPNPSNDRNNIHLLFYDVVLNAQGEEVFSKLITRADHCWHPGDPTTPRTFTGTPYAYRVDPGHRVKVVVLGLAKEFSMPSMWLLRMRPVFRDTSVEILHQQGQASLVKLPLLQQTDLPPEGPLQESDAWAVHFFDGVASGPTVYASDTTLTLLGNGTAIHHRLNGGPEEVTPGQEVVLSFTEDGDYTVEYAVEAADGKLTDWQTESFTITKRPLSLEAIQLPEAPNSGGWYAGAVQVQFFCLPGPAELDECPVEPVLLSGDGIGQTATATATDTLGNTATLTAGAFNIDQTAPQVSETLPETKTFCTGATQKVEFTVSDALSGLESSSATFNDQPVNSGQQKSLTAGKNILAVEAQDVAGNVALTEASVQVSYDETLLFPPDGEPITPGVPLPFKFTITDACSGNGKYGQAVGALWLTGPDGVEIPAEWYGSATGNMFTYDSLTGWYNFDVDTSGLKAGTWTARLNLDDGNDYSTTFVVP